MELYISVLVFVVLLMLGCIIYHWRTNDKVNNIKTKEQIVEGIKTIPSTIKSNSIKGIVSNLPDSVTYDIIKEASKNIPIDKLRRDERIDNLMANQIKISDLPTNDKDSKNYTIDLPWDDIPYDSNNDKIPGYEYKSKYEININKIDDSHKISTIY